MGQPIRDKYSNDSTNEKWVLTWCPLLTHVLRVEPLTDQPETIIVSDQWTNIVLQDTWISRERWSRSLYISIWSCEQYLATSILSCRNLINQSEILVFFCVKQNQKYLPDPYVMGLSIRRIRFQHHVFSRSQRITLISVRVYTEQSQLGCSGEVPGRDHLLQEHQLLININQSECSIAWHQPIRM